VKCVSGKHEWTERVSAERCCSGKWQRQLRLFGEHGDLNPLGRIYSGSLVYGWVRSPEEPAQIAHQLERTRS
jgi:hypothetical protein